MKPRVPASKYKKFIEFVELLKANNAMSYFDNCHKWTLAERNDLWVDSGFEWAKSEEGHDFWSDINRQWHDKLQREQNR